VYASKQHILLYSFYKNRFILSIVFCYLQFFNHCFNLCNFFTVYNISCCMDWPHFIYKVLIYAMMDISVVSHFFLFLTMVLWTFLYTSSGAYVQRFPLRNAPTTGICRSGDSVSTTLLGNSSCFS
jgi:hypothetical protein